MSTLDAFTLPEGLRIQGPGHITRPGDPGGAFMVESRDPSRVTKTTLFIIATAETPGAISWEHVSVHAAKNLNGRKKVMTPTWAEMCQVKDLFWGPEATVLQYHPPASEYVNYHPHVLHLWRPTGIEIPRPERILV